MLLSTKLRSPESSVWLSYRKIFSCLSLNSPSFSYSYFFHEIDSSYSYSSSWWYALFSHDIIRKLHGFQGISLYPFFWNTCERNKTSSNYMQNTRSLLNPFQNSFNYNVFLFTLKTQDTSTDIQIQYWSYKTLLFFLNDANRGEYFIMNHDTCSSSTLPIKQ